MVMHTNQHINPLFQQGVESNCRASQVSFTREHPQPQTSPADDKPVHKQANQRLCSFCHAIPWIATVCAAIAVAALVVWTSHSDAMQTSMLGTFRHIGVKEQLLDRISASVDAVQIAVVASISSVMGLLLLAGVIRKLQIHQKRRALTYSDWPRGCRVHCYRVLMTLLLIGVWLASAATVCLLCITFSIAGLALAGDITAGKVIKVAGSVKITAGLAMSSDQAANSTTNSSCQSTCLNLALLANALPTSDFQAVDWCICPQQRLSYMQQQLHSMWQAGVIACIALAALLAVGSWMLMLGAGECVSAQKDHQHATSLAKGHEQTHQRNSMVRDWINSSPLPSLKEHQRQQGHLMIPDLRGSMSPAKEKQTSLEWSESADIGMAADVEQPAPHIDQLSSPVSQLGSRSSQPSYVRHTTASMARQSDTLRSTTSSDGRTQHSRRRWQ